MSPTNFSRHKYTPDEIDEEEFLDRFVVRTDEFNDLYEALTKTDYRKPQQHFIVVGQRGQGKTTLLRRIMIAVEQDEELSRFLIAVKFTEEQYQIRSLCRLWEEVADYLQSLHSEEFGDILDKMEEHFGDENYGLLCFSYLEQYVKSKNKKLLLLIDNIDELLGKFKEKEQHQLREILISSSTFRIIGGSTKMIEQHYDYGKPFYEFFQVVRLQGLGQDECIRFLRVIGDEAQRKKINQIITKSPERVETLRRLTGGVPRTIVMLFDIFVDDQGDAFEDLLKVLDEATPLYKHRMDDLPATLQDITHAIAMNWDGLGTKEISARTRLQSKEVSAQLKQLENKYGIVDSISIGKNKIYKLEERFFNIWYLMRFGRKKDRQKVEWLVRFLESWCSPDELEQRAQQFLQAVTDGKVKTNYAYHMCEALGYAGLSAKTEYTMKEKVREFLLKEGSDLAKVVSSSENELLGKVKDLAEQGLIDKAIDLLEKKSCRTADFYLLLGLLHSANKNYARAEQYYLKALENGDNDALVNLGNLYRKQEDYAQAEQYFMQALESGDNDALINLGAIYGEQEDYAKAEQYFMQALESGDNDALFNLGVVYGEQEDYAQAEQYYLEALESGDNDALFNLGVMYGEQVDYSQAEQYYLKALESGDNGALINLGNLYRKQEDYAQAKQYYLKALESGDNDALFNLGSLFLEQEDYTQAKQYFLKALESGNNDALFNLGAMYGNQKDYAQAEQYYLKSLERGDFQANNLLSWLYFDQGEKLEEAIQFAKRSYDTGKEFANTHTYAAVLLWTEEFNASYLVFSEWLQFDSAIDADDDLTIYFLLLLAKGQYSQAKKFLEIEEYQLKDRLKPVWFALMSLMQDEYPNEIIKMGGELQETVDEMLLTIKNMEQKYAID